MEALGRRTKAEVKRLRDEDTDIDKRIKRELGNARMTLGAAHNTAINEARENVRLKMGNMVKLRQMERVGGLISSTIGAKNQMEILSDFHAMLQPELADMQQRFNAVPANAPNYGPTNQMHADARARIRDYTAGLGHNPLLDLNVPDEEVQAELLVNFAQHKS